MSSFKRDKKEEEDGKFGILSSTDTNSFDTTIQQIQCIFSGNKSFY